MAVLALLMGGPSRFMCWPRCGAQRSLERGRQSARPYTSGFAGLPPCDDMDLALRLFVADELIEAGATPATLMKAQNFDPAPLNLLKFNPAQPRWPAGNGRNSGEWSVAMAISRGGKESRRHGGGSRFDPFRAIGEFIDEWRKPKDSGLLRKRNRQSRRFPPRSIGRSTRKGLNYRQISTQIKLHHIFDKAGRGLDNLVAAFGSQKAAFREIETAVRETVKEQQISGEFKIRVEVGGRELTVKAP
jgi:hypothetical protein